MSSEQRKNLKQEYGWLYEALTQLLAEDDPMYLVKGGAPRNEYEPEVDVILRRLPEASSPSTLGHVIYEAFVQCFGSTFSPSSGQLPSEQTKKRFAVLGEKAWTSWTRWKEEAKPEHGQGERRDHLRLPVE